MPKWLRTYGVGLLFILPYAVYFLLFVAYPFFYSFYMSLLDMGLRPGATFVGLRNYEQLMADPTFWHAFRNTIEYAVLAVIGQTLVPLIVAIALNERIKFRGLFRVSFFLPVVTSWVVISLLWSWLYSSNGLVNYLFDLVHLPEQPFLASRTQAMPSIVLMSIWKDLGYYMVIFLAGLQGIPEMLYEAAVIDGASVLQRIRYITVPLLRPITFFVVMISALRSMQLFTQSYIMTNGGPLDATLSIVLYIYRVSFRQFHVGYGSAAAVCLFFFLIILSMAMRAVYNRTQNE